MSAPAQWLLTYLLHGTVLLGAAALLCAALRDRRLALQEAVLRACLLGGFLTASLQVGLGLEPLGGVLRVGTPADDGAVAARVTDDGVVDGTVVEAGPARGVVRPDATEGVPRSEVTTAAEPSASAGFRWSWRAVLLSGWALLAVLGLVRLGVGAVRLRGLLRPRTSLDGVAVGARARRIAAALGLRRHVPLHAASRLTVPLATGVLAPGVFLPARAVEELDEEAMAALCAHELAHVARRDPAWILLARVLEAAVPVQPLHGWARRRLGEIAELLSDDLAVCASARPRRLARSLVDVASWTLDGADFSPALALGALSTRSRLGHRVERLMDPLHTPERPRRLLLPLVAVVVAATALVTPVVTGAARASAAPPADPVPAAVADGASESDLQADVDVAAEADLDDAADAGSARARDERRRELEALSERIAARAAARAEEMETLEREIEAHVGAGVDPAEMARVESDLRSAIGELVAARHSRRDGGESDEELRARVEDARRRMEAAREALREAVGTMRLSAEDQKRIAETARRVAESVRPTPEELARLRELSRDIAEDVTAHREDLVALGDLQRELGETGARELRESLAQLRRSLRESLDAIPDVSEIVRSAMEAAREAELGVRDALAHDSLAEREGRSRLDTPPPPPEAPVAPAPPAPPEAPEPPPVPED